MDNLSLFIKHPRMKGDFFCTDLKEAYKKVIFLVARPLRGGGAKKLFLKRFKKDSQKCGHSARGGGRGVTALVAGPIKRSFFAASLTRKGIIANVAA